MSSKSISQLFSVLLVCFPLVCNFDIFVITPMLFLCIFEFFLILLWHTTGKTIKIDRNIFPYFIFTLIIETISIMQSSGGSIYSIIIRDFFFFLILLVFYICYWQVFDYELAIKCYIRISLILSVLIIVQFMLAQIGKGVCLLPPGIPVIGDNGITTNLYRNNQILLNRYCTIFLEPAHQATYTIPCFTVVLFRDVKDKKRDVVLAIILTLGIICTTSSIGIFGIMIIWFFYFFYLYISGKIRKAYWVLFLIPLLVLIAVYFLGKEDIITNLSQRIAVLDIRNKDRTEGFRRIRYGWICFGKLNIIQKIVGLGYQNFGYYLSKSGIGYELLGTDDLVFVSYANGITSMLLGLGIIGSFLNLRLYLIRALKSNNFLIYALCLSWAIIMFTTSSFDNISSLVLVVFIMFNLNIKMGLPKGYVIK